MEEVQIQKEVKRLDKKIDSLNSLVSKLIKILEAQKSTSLEREFKASYVKKIKNAMKEIEQGKVKHYKDFDEFSKSLG